MKRNRIPNLLLAICCSLLMLSCKKDDDDKVVIERGTVSDIEGNVYQTVKIGDQWWMAENLRVTKFNDGSELNFISSSDQDSLWANAMNASYSSINDAQFGFLYNGKVVLNERNIAPVGWHIPTDADWKKLELEIGMKESELDQTGWRGEKEGEKLTSKYSAGWPDGGLLFGSDDFGFNALPGGCRIFDGRSNIFGNTAFWWSSPESDSQIWYRHIDKMGTTIFRHHTYVQYGMSIRCVKD